ncbi:MAG: succinate dehydrogenase, cytochrome b556 subunit [Pseudomonadota bacterium]
MGLTKKRPVFLNLLQIRLPVTGVVSILHRVSGVVLALCVPLLIYLFDLSVRGPEGYAQALDMLAHPVVKLLATLGLWMLGYHALNGVRVLLIDIDIGVQKPAARRSAWWVHGGATLILLLAIAVLWR